MTEQEFLQQLDLLVTTAIRELSAGVVYGHLSTVKQFTQVVYDTSVVNYLQSFQNQPQPQVETKEGESE
jgi:hypothetical protein